MKRNQNLVTLSWEHHDGLVVAFRLQKGLKASIPLSDLSSYILFSWEQVLRQHFWQEEQVIHPRLFDTPEGRTAVGRMMNEHSRFRELIDALKKGQSNGKQIDAFINLLNTHIRFEERNLFPILEKQCSTEELTSIGDFLRRHHPSACADYPHKFWRKS
jgi:hemerythrin-like domain-containing protein